MADLPSGMVTFLFTDIEGSTPLWEREPDQMRFALARHHAILRTTIATAGGHAFKTIGDAFQAAFALPTQAVSAALAAQRALATQTWETSEPIRVRIGLHIGIAVAEETDYSTTHTLNRVARIMAAGHGGQILLSSEVADLVRRDMPTDVTVRDLGTHRMKGLTHLEHLFQLVAPDLPAAFPPLKTLGHHPSNLPLQSTPLIGREKEISMVCSVLRRTDVRLITLTGPGGTGKTRLALQAAAELVDQFSDGVWFANLAPVSDPDLVATTIAQTFGLRETDNRPLRDSLKDYLHEKHLLLLLDNFEQVVGAAPLVADLLAAVSGLNILVTSRVVLHLSGEREIAVPPLGLPARADLLPLERLTQYEAVRLFIERAQAANADFGVTNSNASVVAEICHRLDGLPLAIELAAARSKLLSPQALLVRLGNRLKVLTGGTRDLPARQQTIRNTIDWSYNLLDTAQQTLFRRLGVFVGGWTEQAAEVVCNAMGDIQIDLLDGLAALLDQSLLRQVEGSDGEPRFTMLETIREYALERLMEGAATEALRQRHAEYYLVLAEAAELELRGPRQGAWFNQLEAEHENLRAALRWYTDREDAVQLAQLTGALFWFWASHGHVREGHEWLERALARSNGLPIAVRAKALLAAGRMASGQGNYERARGLSTEALILYRGLGEPSGIAAALNILGWDAHLHGESAQAKALFEEGLALCREHADRQGIADALGFLAQILWRQGNLVAARTVYEERLTVCRELRDTGAIAETLWGLGYVAHLQGDVTHATPLLKESLALYRELGHKEGISDVLVGLGHVAYIQGDYKEAAARYEASLVLRRERGDRRGSSAMLTCAGGAALAQGDLVRAKAQLLEGLALSHALGYKAGIAESLQTLGCLAGAVAQPEQAARLWGAAEVLREASGTQLDTVDRIGYDRVAPAVRAALDKRTFTAAWAAGRTLILEQAIAEAEYIRLDQETAAVTQPEPIQKGE